MALEEYQISGDRLYFEKSPDNWIDIKAAGFPPPKRKAPADGCLRRSGAAGPKSRSYSLKFGALILLQIMAPKGGMIF